MVSLRSVFFVLCVYLHFIFPSLFLLHSIVLPFWVLPLTPVSDGLGIGSYHKKNIVLHGQEWSFLQPVMNCRRNTLVIRSKMSKVIWMTDGEYGRTRLNSLLRSEGRSTLLDWHLRITLALHSIISNDRGMSWPGVVLGEPQQTLLWLSEGPAWID